MRHNEAMEQEKVMSWAYKNESRLPALRWLFHPANGGRRDKKTAFFLRKIGVKAGVSDLILLHPAGGYHGLLLEMKVGKGKLSSFQDRFLKYHSAIGYKTAVCFTAEEAIKTIKEYLNG